LGKRNSFLKKLESPYYPSTDNAGKPKHDWHIYTIEEKYVAEYCKISILDVEELDLIAYLCYLRDAKIYQLSLTESGQEYLENAWRIKQTAPDREALRNKYGRLKEDSR
jgi:hypothetical protein